MKTASNQLHVLDAKAAKCLTEVCLSVRVPLRGVRPWTPGTNRATRRGGCLKADVRHARKMTGRR